MRALLLLVLVPTAVLAQSAPEQPQPQQVDDRSFWQRCGPGYSSTADASPVVRLDVPLYAPASAPSTSPRSAPSGTGAGGTSSTGASSLGSGGGSAPEAFLVMAVIAVAVLPFIIYATDADPDQKTLDRFYCPEFSFSALAGVEAPANGIAPAAGLGTARVRAGMGYFGLMTQVDVAPTRGPYTAFSAHLLLRAKPKQHLEGGLALGARRAVMGGQALDGFEVALPHQYVLWREGRRSLGIELMPRVFIHAHGVDVGVDAAVVIPLGEYVQLRAGGTAWSFAGQTQLGASAGLSAKL